MKAKVIFCISFISIMYAFNDPLIFKPFSGTCARALNQCFNQCAKQKTNSKNHCIEKKNCLNRCNFKLARSMRPEKCYKKCDTIPCKSIADCTLDCFKESPEGTCREECRNATKQCLDECKSTFNEKEGKKERYHCMDCCYTQKQLCKKRCCL